MHSSGRWDRNIGWGWHPASQKISGTVDEKDACAQVYNDLDLYFIVCEFNMYSDDVHVHRKPLATESPKKTIKPATASQTIPKVVTTPIPPPAGVTGSTTMSPIEAWHHCRWAAEFLESLKNKEVDREGNPFLPLLLFSSDFDSWLSWSAVLAEELAATQKALSTEKSAWSTADQALVEERAARQVAE
jgi:hypothetical protein